MINSSEHHILQNDRLRAVIAPALGGGLLRLDALEGARGCPPILRPWSGKAVNPAERAMFVMVPWCNRISSGGFRLDGRHHDIRPNLDDQPMPIHGTGFMKVWDVVSATRDRVTLRLAEASVPPFRFEATLDYQLGSNFLKTSLHLVHQGAAPVPYGLGFHPWFCWSAGDRLQFDAGHFVVENQHRLPVEIRQVKTGDHDDFVLPRQLMADLFNGTYLDWDRSCQILRADGHRVQMTASGAAKHLHVFSRGNDSGFLCLEPVSHTVDALNRPMRGDALPQVLSNSEMLETEMVISWQ